LNIETAIPEIIALAFDGKGDVGGIRITAIHLLREVALSSKTIPPYAINFTTLLEVEHLRPSLVELLSVMSQDPNGN
jgi:hypothetical protein